MPFQKSHQQTPGLAARPDYWQFARFVVVGVVNTGFSYFLYAALVYFGMAYAVANLVALVVGILFSFKTQGRLVFRRGGNHRLWRFVLVWTIIYVANTLIITLFIDKGLNAYVAGAAALPFTVILSYLAQKFFVFSTKRIVENNQPNRSESR